MITINLSEKDAATLKFILTSASCDSINEMLVMREAVKQINNQQFDVSDFESSRQYESLSIQNAGYLNNWDKATKNVGFVEG